LNECMVVNVNTELKYDEDLSKAPLSRSLLVS
jgi:hypothetical protein